MLRMRLYHGRTMPEGSATDELGNPTDDWGFDGPVLVGIAGMDFTYGDWMLNFTDAAAYDRARMQTSWREGNGEFSLTIDTTSTEGDLIRIWNDERHRYEWFGDFWLSETP